LALPEREAQEQAVAVAAVKGWLEGNTDWLLIFDNADDLPMVSEFLPSGGKGHLILTSRAQVTGKVGRRVEIKKMTPEEGSLFLLRRSKSIAKEDSVEAVSKEDRALARDICDKMDGLPLALDQAGAYMEETSSSLAGYLDLYRTHSMKLLQHRGGVLADHPDPVAQTWALSFEKIEEANPAAAHLLDFCSFLHPDGIPEEILTEGADQLGPVLAPVAEDPFALNEAIAEALKFSLLHRNRETNTLDIHRLVQSVLQSAMDETIKGQWAERVVRAVDQALPDVEFSNWPQWDRLLSQAQSCAKLIEKWNLELEEAGGLLNKTGFYLKQRARYEEAEPLYQRSLVIREKVLGDRHPDVAVALNNLAQLLADTNRLQEAEPLMRRALEIDEASLGEDHPNVAIRLNNLAQLLADTNRRKEAEPLMRRALEIDEASLGEDHPIVAIRLNNLAQLLNDTNRRKEAEPLMRRALEIDTASLGEDHPIVARDLNNLAQLLNDTNRRKEAEPLMRRALEIFQESLGEDHPSTQTVRGNLDRLLADLKSRKT